MISKPDAKCKDDPNYKPDQEMTALLSKSLGCNLPWNNLKLDGINDCETEEDFELYLKEIMKQQEVFKGIAKKCQYKVWSTTHWRKVAWREDGNSDTMITIGLIITEGQVHKYLHNST